MTRVVYDRAARDDLAHIRAYIARDRPKTAAKVAGKLRAACRRLGRHPELGKPMPALGEGIHIRNEDDGFTVVYEVSDPLIIHRVLGRGMDVGRALDQ